MRPGGITYSIAAGSGYVIDKQGHAITNMHVTGHEQIVEIAFFGEEDTKERHKAIVVGEDPQLDLAIIKIDADPSLLHPIKLADSDKIQVGDVVATCGSPGGDVGTVDPSNFQTSWLDYFNLNLGVVDEILNFQQSYQFYSMTRLFGQMENMGQYYGSGVQYLFHVSASINHGNSGGPAINAYGEAIGTNTWGFGSLENVGYSVPTNFLKRSANNLIQYGRPITPWFGIVCHPPEPPYKWTNYDAATGITNKWQMWFDVEVSKPEVLHVNPYSPAFKAGIRKGDRILSVDNMKFDNVFKLYSYILNGRIGQKMTVMIERNGTEYPPIIVELAEKKVRYDTTYIDTFSMAGPMYGYEDSYSKPYRVTLTY
jgi:serine protease Do